MFTQVRVDRHKPLTLEYNETFVYIFRIPYDFVFRRLNTEHGELTRLYFLGTPNNLNENTLLYVDLPAEMKPEAELQEALEWNLLLDSFQSVMQHNQYSKVHKMIKLL